MDKTMMTWACAWTASNLSCQSHSLSTQLPTKESCLSSPCWFGRATFRISTADGSLKILCQLILLLLLCMLNTDES